MRLKDRVAIITGGRPGYLSRIALTYGRGARVALNHVNPTTCEETAAEAANRLHMHWGSGLSVPGRRFSGGRID